MTDRTRRSFAIEEAAALLSRTPSTLDALLRGLPDGWIAAHEGGDTWSPFEIIGHLIQYSDEVGPWRRLSADHQRNAGLIATAVDAAARASTSDDEGDIAS